MSCGPSSRTYKTERPRLAWQSGRLDNCGAHERVVADAVEVDGQACQREALAAREGELLGSGLGLGLDLGVRLRLRLKVG